MAERPSSSRWGLRRLRALPALLLWAAGCEALVNGQLGDVRCLAEGAVGPPACPAGYACSGGVCVPSGLGAPCVTDADCSPSDFCLDPLVFGAPGGGRCSRACCTSGDCDADGLFVCAIAPAGGSSFCRLAADAHRAAGGTRQAMQPCVEDGECRSGRCLEGLCLDTCCSDTVCAVGAAWSADAGSADAGGVPPVAGACRFGQPAAGEAFGFWCAAPVPGAPRYASCEQDVGCASGLCAPFGPGGMSCASPCCTSADCAGGTGPAVRCVTLPGPHPVRACAALAAPDAAGEIGDPCATGDDCRGGLCVGHMCSDSCCSDMSCGDPASLGCRPTSAGGAWALQCVLK